MARTPAAPRSILTLGLPPGGRGAALTVADQVPAFGSLNLDDLAQARGAIDAGLAPRGLLVPGEDLALGAAERQGGRLLSALLHGPEMREIAARLGLQWAAAQVARAPMELLLDLRDPALWSLPWELLELLPEGEPLGGCRVARLVEGAGAPAEARERLDVRVWSPTPEDPDCAAVLDALDRRLAQTPRVRRVNADEEAHGGEGAGRVVHVVCHGGERGEPVLELGQERSLDAATLGRVLQPLLEGASLVVLDVCGAAGGDEPEALPACRVVGAGALACLAPRAALDVEASIAMSEALYGALAEGASLLTAVQAARRAVAALGLPDPSARWWSLTLVGSRPAIFDFSPLCLATARAPALARAAPDAAALLERAAELAEAQGFFGLEHIALALGRARDLPPLLALAQPHFAGVAARAAGFQPAGSGGSALSPRLQALLDALPEGFDLLTLLRAVAGSRPVRLDAPGLAGLIREAGPLSATLSGDGSVRLPPEVGQEASEEGGLLLEVVGGPEDGLQRRLDADRPLLGRWDPLGGQPEVCVLYAGAGATDLAVSRRHLRWRGGGGLEALAPARLRRAGALLPEAQLWTLRRGDLLELGQATRLHVLSVPR